MSESDPSTKKPGVPSWQLPSRPAETGETEQLPPESLSRETVIEQAKKFLEEDEVRDASTDKKVAFLESKGLQGDEIQKLLGVTRNQEATASPSQVSSSQQEAYEQLLTASKNSPAPPQDPSSPTMTQQPYTPQQRDTPPIITYPEFLTTPPHPSPLVTKSRLLTTLYLFGGLSALLYGTNAYLLEPMLASLTTSRLSLAESASANLDKLINKLESVVSEVPTKGSRMEVEAEDEESDEDPTEMFHRDIGVQTSLPSTPHSTPADSGPETTPLSDQTSRLQYLKTTISDLVEESTSEGNETNHLSITITILKEYLDGMAYVVPNYGYTSSYGGALGGSSSKEQDDEIGRVKASIRGVKGVLLSARSFPRGVQ